MNIELLGISVLWLFLFCYVFMGAIEFGAGFYNAYGRATGKQNILEKVIQRYLSPVWEISNVFLVFFFVGIIGFFPRTAYYYGTTLLVPVSIALILLSIRAAYYAFATYGRGETRFTFIYGLTGLFLPASLSIVLAISEGGFVFMSETGPALDYWALFTSLFSWSIVILSFTSVLFISAVFLTWYASYAKNGKAEAILRKHALIWALPFIVSGLGLSVVMRGHNGEHFARLFDVWWLFAISLLLFIGVVYFVWQKKRYGLAVALLALQYFIAFFGYGISHYPYLLYPYLTVVDGFTNHGMATALITAFIGGLLLLIPSLYLLLRLFLFDKEYIAGKRINHA